MMYKLPWAAAGATLGILLAVALLLLLLPFSPVSQLPQAVELDRRGNVGGFQPAAGAGVTYDSPGPTLQALGISFQRRLIPLSVTSGGETWTNYTPSGIAPRAIVVHNTDTPTSTGCGPLYNVFSSKRQASTNFCIDGSGKVVQLVPLEAIAWGNGDLRSPNRAIPLIDEVVRNGWWMNQFTWSIELVLDYQPTTEYAEQSPRMLDSLAALVKFLAAQGGIPLDRDHILAHRDINSITRVDPVCCWRPGGLAAGAQAFDSWVTSLAPAPPPSPDGVDEILAALDALTVTVEDLIGRVEILEGAPSVPSPTPTPTPMPQPTFRWYTVQSSDWDGLGGIAQRELGDANRWVEIATLNGIASPYIIHVGQQLKLPLR